MRTHSVTFSHIKSLNTKMGAQCLVHSPTFSQNDEDQKSSGLNIFHHCWSYHMGSNSGFIFPSPHLILAGAGYLTSVEQCLFIGCAPI